MLSSSGCDALVRTSNQFSPDWHSTTNSCNAALRGRLPFPLSAMRK
jgi:hypothetical protein